MGFKSLTFLSYVLWATVLGCLAALLLFGGPSVIGAYKEARFDPAALAYPDNTLYLDRYGRELRSQPDARGERHAWVRGSDVPRILKDAFLAAEDARFYHHDGFDVKAIARAAFDDLRAGRIVSGASTISQQVIRLTYPRKRTLHDKLVELFRSVSMEDALTKDEIFEQYLNRVPMGGNIVGVELAAREYFGKSCRDLDPAECALLASIPKAPTYLDPNGPNRGRLMARKDWVLGRMRALGFIKEADYASALVYPLKLREPSFAFNAPHFVDMLVMRGVTRPGRLTTTLDLDMQSRLEKALASHRVRLTKRGAVQAAAMVVRNSTMDTLALSGSFAYSDKDMGYNNGATALRSAGSTLKPFLYGLALERGVTAADLVEDTERKYRTPGGVYAPYNFDRRQYGPVTVRMALANSLNLSAVKTLERVGYGPFYRLLERIDLVKPVSGGAQYYGLGMAVGNPEVSLEGLVTAYAMLANGGAYTPARYVRGGRKAARANAVFEPETCYIVSDILSDPSARSITFGAPLSMDFPFRVSLKTGTSTDYRDCWAIGYTPEYTVGVWVGNFGGTPTQGLSGATAAVPVLSDIIAFLYQGGTPARSARPDGVVTASVCGYSGMRPTENCEHVTEELFIAGTEPRKTCEFHAGGKDRHELSAPYAAWLYDKYTHGSAGKYRISALPDDLSDAFEDPSGAMPEDTGPAPVRVLSEVVAGKPALHGPEAMPDASGGRYIIAAGLEGVGNGASSRRNRLRIAYPMNGDRYVMDPYARSRTIVLQAVTEEPVPYVEWFVDGRPYTRSRPPYQSYWELKRGAHLVTAVDPSNNGASVRIVVE